MKKWFTILLTILLVLSGCKKEENNEIDSDDVSYADTSGMEFSFTDRDLDSSIGSNAITLNESNVEITKEGTYVLSGNYTSVNIAVGDKEKVQLVLKNATIENENGPAILIESGDKVFITLYENTTNTISDGKSYDVTVDDSQVDGAIFSKSDLTINGNGNLTVNGNYKHGIVSKDDLVVVDASLTVDSNDVGLDGKDCVKIKDAVLDIESVSDGIRSNNSEDEDRGYVYIESGEFDIQAGNDGIQAETVLKIVDGTFNITSGIGSEGYLTSSEESYKGLKATSDILIEDGTFNLDTQDDCIHSNNTLSISNGTFTLSSGDDGIHADNELLIKDGTISISKSYEGIEASIIRISGGNIDLVASDDGLNAAGGTLTTTDANIVNTSYGPGGNGQQGPGGNGSGGQERPGMGNFTNSYGEIYISGGYIYANASGDGIDSNGIVGISGGILLVSGPTNNGNGAFDYENSATITNGTIIALGSSGMAQSIQSDNQGVLGFTMGTQSAGTSLTITDEEGNLIVSIVGEKQYECAVISTPNLTKNQTYQVIVNANVNDADEHGYTENSSYSNGTVLGSLDAQ